MAKVRSIRLSQWGDIHQFARHGWLYRGHGSATWPLQTSLERCFKRLRVARQKRADLERKLIREFQRAYHQYSARIPPDEAMVEWLSLMQHHGAPTRLLDVTYSIYVAAYFALERADGDAVVWGFNAPWAAQESSRLLAKAGKCSPTEALEPVTVRNEPLAEDWFFAKPTVRLTYPVNPFRLNERLRIQRGAFLIPGDVTRTFADNLAAMAECSDPQHVIRLVLPRRVRLSALRELFAMDIARSSLFPGLDGYAESLGVYHSVYFPTDWKGKAEPMPTPDARSTRRPNQRLQPSARVKRGARRG